MNQVRQIAVLGAGAWGTALACVSARNGYETKLWGRNQQHMSNMASLRKNERYLGEIELPQQLTPTSDLAEAVEKAGIILLVTPAQTIVEMAGLLANIVERQTPIILCAKGINNRTGDLPADGLLKAMPGQNVAALSGPSFAKDVAKNLPTAVTLAHDDLQEATAIAQIISGPNFRVYAADDLKGVELGGALKNVIAVGVGVCRGMQLGASAEAALIARGFAEVRRLAGFLGAKQETLMGLSGLGDLVLTCSSTQSRNFSYGLAIGQKLNRTGLPLAEGAHTASIAAKLANDNQIDAPVISMVAKLVGDAITPKSALRELLARPLRSESE